MGTEESKHVSAYNASEGKAIYSSGADINRAPASNIEDKMVALEPRPAINGSQNIPDFIHKKKPQEIGSHRKKSDELPRNHKKPKSEYMDRHHNADDKLSRDREPKEKRKTMSRNSDSPARRKNLHKHLDQRSKDKHHTSKPEKNKKEKERHSKHKERGQKSRKQKLETVLSRNKEDVDDEKPVGKVKNVRNKKRKSDLEKHKKNHRSAPDLTSSDTSKVGAWLNSAAYYWQQESPSWHSSNGYPYATLPGPYTLTSLEKNRKPLPVVDGMGSPVGTALPDGTFMPDSADSPANLQSISRSNLANRSRSDNHIDLMDHGVILHGKVLRQKHQNKKRVISSASPEGGLLTRESVSSIPRARGDTMEFYSDIVQTRDLLTLAYKANQEISVDNVRHADFILNDENSSDVTDSDSSSMSDSSSNDIILDGSDVRELVKAVKSSSLPTRNEPSNVKVFQPASKREVFIDNETNQHENDQPSQPSSATSTTTAGSQTAGGKKAPIMTLSERESIVATSFLTNGGKVFCLTKAKLRPTPLPTDKEETRPINTQQEAVIMSTAAYQQAEIQVTTSKADPSKRESGTWFGLTGSPPTSKSVKNFSFNVEKEPSQTFLKIKPNSVKQVITTSEKEVSEERLVPVQLLTPTFLPQESSLNSLLRKRPEENIAPNSGDSVPKKTDTHQDTKMHSFNLKHQEAFDHPSSDSSVSDPFMLDDDHGVAKKLVRIDSHDSSTMTKRLRNHRRSSSQSERVPGYPGSLDRRATIAVCVPQDDLRIGHGRTSASHGSRSVYVQSPPLRSEGNPFHYSFSPELDSFLYKVKSEEALKHAMRRSRESLMTDVSPCAKKETLQERAARILGLSSAYVVDAKEKQEAKALTTSCSTNESLSVGKSTGRLTYVTPTQTAQGNISHPILKSKLFSSTDDLAESSVFAVSITESMLQRPQDKFVVKSVPSCDGSNSSADICSISEDTVGSQTSDRLTSTRNGEYTIEVSDSVLEDASVPVKVKPQKENVSAAKEYKIPINIPTTTTESFTEKVQSPGSGQASIVASYANSIYDHTPGSSAGHSRDYSDDTTETESLLDQSGHYRELVAKSAAIRGHVTSSMDSNLSDESSFTAAPTVVNRPTSISSQNEARAVNSPVPIASHSAPLTSRELDIIMQLYNSADESTSICSKDVNERKSVPTPKTQNAHLRKQKIAQAIGFDVRNIDQGRSKNVISKDVQLQKVEDFDIKIFHAGAATWTDQQDKSTTYRGESETRSKPSEEGDDVLEAMQSLGLNPDESWLVSL